MEDYYRWENDSQDDEIFDDVIFLDELPIPGEVDDPNEYPSDYPTADEEDAAQEYLETVPGYSD